MILTRDELICFNSVLDKKSIFGFHESIPKDHGDEYIQSTLLAMREKKMLDENNQPTPSFVIVAKTLEEYKNSSIYVSVNEGHIAVCPEHVILLAKSQNGYQIMMIDTVLFLHRFQHDISLFQSAENEKAEILNQRKLSSAEYLEEYRKQKPLDFYWMQRYENNRITKSALMYRLEDGTRLLYDVLNQNIYTANGMWINAFMNSFFAMQMEDKKQ